MADKQETAVGKQVGKNSLENAAKAKDIIVDAFRRADKNDDGSLSVDEFLAYFGDGILSNDHLKEIFQKIDTHHTNNLDVEEIWEYFAKFCGPFEQIFAILGDLGLSITNAMTLTAQNYEGQSFMEQFATRFLLKETLSHMSALERPLESAIVKLEERALQESEVNVDGGGVDATKQSSAAEGKVAKPRWHKRVYRSASQFSDCLGGSSIENLSGEVARLAGLISRLECKIKLETVEEEEVPPGASNTVVLVSRSYEVLDESLGEFRQALKYYTEAVTSQPGSLHVTVQVIAGSSRFVIYEVWQDDDCLNDHYASKTSKTFRRCCVDLLKKPEVNNSFAIPSSWWPSES